MAEPTSTNRKGPSELPSDNRRSSQVRNTAESKINVILELDGTGQYDVNTGNGMLDHLLAQLSRHGLLNLTVESKGDLTSGWHHLVEDTAITLGRAINEAVGEGRGIIRTAHAIVPLDEALVQVVIDLSGRGYAVIDESIRSMESEILSGDLVRHFLEVLAVEGRFNLHVDIIRGKNSHHMSEALFKALARALRQAVKVDPLYGQAIPSTKGTITG
jgi:imidazoleglycerol-phosphate dehydratase